jgi:hypothetical protein
MAKERKPNVMDSENLCEPCCPMDMKPCMNPSNILEVWHTRFGWWPCTLSVPPPPTQEKSCSRFSRDHVWSILVLMKLRGDVPNMRGPNKCSVGIEGGPWIFFFWGGVKPYVLQRRMMSLPNVKKIDKIYTSGTPFFWWKGVPLAKSPLVYMLWNVIIYGDAK